MNKIKRNDKFKVTVGIPTYEAGDSLVAALSSVYNQTVWNHICEVIVLVDGNMIAKNVLEKINHSKLKIVYAPKREGQSARINNILTDAKGDLIVLTNDDIILKTDAIEKMVESWYLTNAGLLAGRVTPLSASSHTEKMLEIQNTGIYTIINMLKGDNYLACNGRLIALSSNFAKTVNLPIALKNNDAYIYIKAKLENVSFKYVSNAICYYRNPSRLTEYFKQSVKFQNSLKDNARYFQVDIKKYYTIPKTVLVKSFLSVFIENPAKSIIYLLLKLYAATLAIFRNKHTDTRSGIWDTEQSTKCLNTNAAPIQVCFFGSYDKNYSRNQIILKGLRLNNVKLVEVHLELEKSAISNEKDLTVFKMLKRSFRKFKLIPIILKNLKNIRNSDVIFSAFPTHLDIPFAYIIAKLYGKQLIFDPMYALSTMFIDEFGLLSKWSYKASLLRLADKIIFSLPDIVLFDSSLSLKYYQKILNISLKKLRVLPVGADNEIYEYSGLNNNKDKLTVIYYGLYNPMHGVEHIVECARLLGERRDIEFVMIGQGQTYEENVKRVGELGLKNMIFMPEITEKNAKEYLEKGDIFLGFLNKSASADNSVPNKVFQGLAMGKVVLTADTPVTKEKFKHKENIYFVNAGDPISLLKGILELKNNFKLMKHIADNGHKIYKEKYTPEIIGKGLMNICASLFKKPKLT